MPTSGLCWILFCSTILATVVAQYSISRYRCNTQLPSRYSIIPNGVVLTGLVTDIQPGNVVDDGQYQASVKVSRVMYGPRTLAGNQITVSGLGTYPQENTWCNTNVRKDESWIFVLQPINYPQYYRLNGSLIRMNRANLERMDAIIADEPYRPHTPVKELPCEKKYCENNANCINDPYSADGARCECLSFCKPAYEPVCGSNGETYNNECELRRKSCLMGKNLFVKSTTSCQLAGRLPSSSYHQSQVQPPPPPASREPGSNTYRTYTTSHRTYTTSNRYSYTH